LRGVATRNGEKRVANGVRVADRHRTGEPCGSPHTAARNRQTTPHENQARKSAGFRCGAVCAYVSGCYSRLPNWRQRADCLLGCGLRQGRRFVSSWLASRRRPRPDGADHYNKSLAFAGFLLGRLCMRSTRQPPVNRATPQRDVGVFWLREICGCPDRLRWLQRAGFPPNGRIQVSVRDGCLVMTCEPPATKAGRRWRLQQKAPRSRGFFSTG